MIKLDNTSAIGVQGALSLPISAPVPEEYAKQFDAENPSTYGDHQVSSGPYMIENDAQGNLTGYTPNKEIHLVRNPNWKASAADFRPAYLDDITIQEGFSDTVSASKKIMAGSAMVNGDFTTPPSVIKQAATSGEEGQLTLTPSGGNRYVALNTTVPPFDDINVRKAVIANANRTDLRNTRGGELTGPVASHFIPPEFPGFEQAGGLKGPGLDYLANPDGDPDLAAEYMKKAGYRERQVRGLRLRDHDGRRRLAPRFGHRRGGEEPVRGARLQGEPAEGHPRRHVHEVLLGAAEHPGRLPELRLAEGLQRRPGDVRRRRSTARTSSRRTTRTRRCSTTRR